MAVAVILVLVAVGSVLFHVLSPWWWTPIASNWSYIDDTINLTFWITGFVFTAVVLFMAYCVFRFRHREGRRAAYEPESARLEWWLTVVTAVGVAAMLAPGLFVWQHFVTVPDGASEFEVVGQQWQWSFRLPGKDGRLGAADTEQRQPGQPPGTESRRSQRPGRCRDRGRRPAPADRQAGQGPAALHRRAARFLRARVPRQDGHGARHGHLLLVHPDADRHVRDPLLRAVRPRAPGHARRVVVEEESDYQAWLQDQPTFAQLAALRARQADLSRPASSGEPAPSSE